MAETEFTTEELESEEWRPVVGYEGYYAVSDLGRVKRIAVNPHNRHGIGRVLAPSYVHNRYALIALSKNGQSAQFRVHTLVAEAFIGPMPKDASQINHKDTNKHNNRADNLEYCTPKQNSQHALAQGRYFIGDKNISRRRPELRQGQRNGNARLTDQQIREIRLSRSNGVSSKDLARSYGVTAHTIRRIVNRANWKHI